MSFQRIMCVYFPKIDCFSQHIGFWWKGKNKYQTQLGMCLTFILVLYFACFTIFYGLQHQELGSKYYLKMEELVDKENIIGNMKHTKQYIIAFGLQDKQNSINYNDISYYNIQAKYIVEKANSDIKQRLLEEQTLPLIKCNDIQIDDDALLEFQKLNNYMCTDLANVDINQNDIIQQIHIDFVLCSTKDSSCQHPDQIDDMLKETFLTIYFPRIAISKDDRSQTSTTIEKKYYELQKQSKQNINFFLRSCQQERSKNFLLYYQQNNSWLNMINSHQNIEYDGYLSSTDITIASIRIDYDQSILESYRVQNYAIIDFIAIVVSQILLLFFIFSQLSSLNTEKTISKEVNDKLFDSKEIEYKLLLKLISKAKDIIAIRKSDGNKFQVPIYDKRQEIGQLNIDNQGSHIEKRDVVSMNTDNFFQFDMNNQQNKSHEVLYTNNVNFIPNYMGFELQNVIKPGRSSRYSIANHEIGYNMKKKSTYDYQSTLQQLQQQKSNLQSYHNITQINRKTSNSLAKQQQQGMNNGLIQQPRESFTNARNSILIPSPSLQNINSQIQLLDQSGHGALQNNNFNNTLTERANTILSPQNYESRGGTLNKHSLMRKDLEFVNDTDNITPLISEKQPNSSNRNSVSNLVKIDLKQIQKKDFQVQDEINNQDVENDISINQFQSNPNGGFHSLRSKQQSLFGASSLKKKQSVQHQGFNMFPQISYQQYNGSNFLSNRLPIINLNAVQPDSNNIPNSFLNNNINSNNCNCIVHNCNNNVNININNNINNLNGQNSVCIAQQRNSKIKLDSKSLVQKLEKVEEDNERDHEQSTKKRLSIHDLDLKYFSFLENNNQANRKQIEYPLLNEVNLLKIIEKLMEFERLKNILLDQNQLAIFEYIVQSSIQKQEYLDQFFKKNNSKITNQLSQNQHAIASFNTQIILLLFDYIQNFIFQSKELQVVEINSILKKKQSQRGNSFYQFIVMKNNYQILQLSWKAMIEKEKQKDKSDLDLRLINSVNQNIYLLVNLSNLDDVLQQSQDQKNHANEIMSEQLINNLNKTNEQASQVVPTRARGQADAIKQRNQRSLSESSCNKIIADENFNY